MNLTIKGKLFAASLVMLTLVSGLVLFLLRVQSDLGNRMNEFIQKNVTAIRNAEQIKHNIVLYDDLVFRYMATNDKFFLIEAVAALGQVEKYIGEARGIVDGETEKAVLSEIEKEAAHYRAGVRKLVETYQSKHKDSEIPKIPEKQGILNMSGELVLPPKEEPGSDKILDASVMGKNRLVRIYSQCEKMVDLYRTKMEISQDQMKAKITTVRRAVYGIGIFVNVSSLMVVFFLMNQILTPIQRLLAGVQKISSGDLSLELPVTSKDEIGSLTEHFNSMTLNIKEKQERLLTETVTDALTGLFNLRYFQNHLHSEILRAQRYHHSFCLLIVDIDHFKIYNDGNGHQMGNVLLKEIADLLKNSVRGDGVTARYGGEEFVLILPETGPEGGKVVAERIRKTVEQTDFSGQEKQPDGNLTVSVGGAVFPQDGTIAPELFNRADQALYKAKKSGRNKAVWA